MKTEKILMNAQGKSIILLIATILVSLSFSKTAVPVFLFSGQSNMVSMASVTDLSADQKKTIDDIMINVSGDCDPSKKGKWLSLGPGFGSQSVNFGMELFFGKTLADSMPDKKIAFIKNAINGSSLGNSNGWLPPSSNNGTGGTHYQNLMRHIDEAIGSFHTAFDTSLYYPRWAGFIWLQGESDAMSQNLADAYQNNLENLIKDIRARLESPDLPVILPMITTGSLWVYSAKIRSADLAVKEKYKNIDTVETKNYRIPDNMHYDASGQINIGRFAALRWLAMHYDYSGIVLVNHRNSANHFPKRLQNTAGVLFFDLSGRKSGSSIRASNLLIAHHSYIGKQNNWAKRVIFR